MKITNGKRAGNHSSSTAPTLSVGIKDKKSEVAGNKAERGLHSAALSSKPLAALPPRVPGAPGAHGLGLRTCPALLGTAPVCALEACFCASLLEHGFPFLLSKRGHLSSPTQGPSPQ